MHILDGKYRLDHTTSRKDAEDKRGMQVINVVEGQCHFEDM